MDDFKTEKWTLDDGRRAERRVTENVNPTGEAERVVELHVEDERPLRLQQRVVEKRRPFVYEREIHTIDKSGNVVEKKIEAVEPKIQMQLVEHVATPAGVSALSVEDPAAGNDCHVTKEEMIETIVSAVRALKEEFAAALPQSVVAAPGSLADQIGRRLNEDQPKADTGGMDKILWGVIVILVIGLGYVIFGM